MTMTTNQLFKAVKKLSKKDQQFIFHLMELMIAENEKQAQSTPEK